MTSRGLRRAVGCGLLAAFSAATPDTGGDWPQWRGPAHSGVSAETGFLSEGRAEPLWHLDVGLGHSSSSVAGGRLFTVGFDVEEEVDVVRCLDAETGEELWAVAYPATLRAAGHGGGTLTTPAVDGERVFVSNRDGGLRCFDAATGDLSWFRDLKTELEVESTDYGFGGSPLVLGEAVIVNVNRTVALDKRTGEELWQTREHLAMYSTPCPMELAGETCVAVFTKEGLHVLEASSGSGLRFHPWVKGRITVNASTPVPLGKGRVFISSGYDHGCALLDVSSGEVEELWATKAMRTKLSGCVLYDGHLYGFDESVLKCLGLDGKERWRKRGLGMGALMAADGRLIVVSEKGELVIVAATPEGYQELARTRVLKGGACWSSPVLADGRIYCRSSLGELVCLDHRPE